MQPPRPSQLRSLRPLHSLAWLHLAINLMLVGGGLVISAGVSHPVAYGCSQLMLALGFTQALVLLHEAGHRTLFRQRRLNDAIGLMAGFVALIPYASWRPIHARHHRFTGWQDLDATTATLVPRPLPRWQQVVIDGAWRYWLPLFSVVYRLQNYWQIGRIEPYLGASVSVSRLRLAAALQLLAYVALVLWWGLTNTLILLGPGLFFALMIQDLLLLSQHTHMPSYNSQGRKVQPFQPLEQGRFTRSLQLPAWLSWLLLHFDAHELHHLYPAVPGYLLRRIPYAPPNDLPWLSWIREAKSLSGTQFLFDGPHLQEERR